MAINNLLYTILSGVPVYDILFGLFERVYLVKPHTKDLYHICVLCLKMFDLFV